MRQAQSDSPVVSRRALLRAIAGGVGAVFVAACGSTSTSSGAPTSAPTSGSVSAQAAATSQPRTGGTLRWGVPDAIVNLDGHFQSQGSDSIALVFDQLTSYDDKLQPQPQLAESWDVTPDFKQIKLNLRKGVQFHSGREFTSDDVKYNLLRVRDPKVTASGLGAQSKWFTSIDTPDKYTLLLTSDQPRPAAFDLFQTLNIVDRETVEGPDGKSRAVGTGPFAFKEWAQGDHLDLVKNQNYWQSGRPYLDGVHIATLADPQAAIAQFEAGALDALKSPALRDFVRYRSDTRFRALTNASTGSFHNMGVDVTRPPTNNKVLRQALNFAIDRKRFVETVLLGVGESLDLPWPTYSPAYDSAKNSYYTFDLDRAKSLLASAGVSNLELDIRVQSANPEQLAFAQIYQADLAQLGITINIMNQELSVWKDQVNNKKYTGLFVALGGGGQLQPSSLFTTGIAFAPSVNNQGFTSPEYEQLIGSVVSEPDAAKRQPLYAQLNDLLLDQSFDMPLATAPARMVTTNALQGVGYSVGQPLFTNAYLSTGASSGTSARIARSSSSVGSASLW
jgi:peptide/nickel transport system substrate-binding protein